MTKRFFCYSSDNGLTFYDTAEEAQAHANQDIKTYRDDAQHDDEWPSEVEDIIWGEVRETATVVPHDEGTCDYKLQAVGA